MCRIDENHEHEVAIVQARNEREQVLIAKIESRKLEIAPLQAAISREVEEMTREMSSGELQELAGQQKIEVEKQDAERAANDQQMLEMIEAGYGIIAHYAKRIRNAGGTE